MVIIKVLVQSVFKGHFESSTHVLISIMFIAFPCITGVVIHNYLKKYYYLEKQITNSLDKNLLLRLFYGDVPLVKVFWFLGVLCPAMLTIILSDSMIHIFNYSIFMALTLFLALILLDYAIIFFVIQAVRKYRGKKLWYYLTIIAIAFRTVFVLIGTVKTFSDFHMYFYNYSAYYIIIALLLLFIFICLKFKKKMKISFNKIKSHTTETITRRTGIVLFILSILFYIGVEYFELIRMHNDDLNLYTGVLVTISCTMYSGLIEKIYKWIIGKNKDIY